MQFTVLTSMLFCSLGRFTSPHLLMGCVDIERTETDKHEASAVGLHTHNSLNECISYSGSSLLFS